MNNTILCVKDAIINGKKVSVEQLYLGGQKIEYKINTSKGSVIVDSNHFWSMNPKIINNEKAI